MVTPLAVRVSCPNHCGSLPAPSAPRSPGAASLPATASAMIMEAASWTRTMEAAFAAAALPLSLGGLAAAVFRIRPTLLGFESGFELGLGL